MEGIDNVKINRIIPIRYRNLLIGLKVCPSLLENIIINFVLIIFTKSLPSNITEIAKADSADIRVIDDIDRASVVVKCKKGIIKNTKI